MMMMSSWRQGCVRQSHYIMLGLTFCYSTPGMLLWTVQKLLKFPFEVKYQCQEASQRESLTLTLFSCGPFQTDPQKGFLSRLFWGSQQSCAFHSRAICPTSWGSKGLRLWSSVEQLPKSKVWRTVYYSPTKRKNITKDSQTSAPNRYKMSLQLQGFRHGLNIFKNVCIKNSDVLKHWA